MNKTVARKKEKDTAKLPKTIQQSIPVMSVSTDGIFEIEPGRFSFVWKFSDINYKIADDEKKEEMLVVYGELLNSLDESAETKITITNRFINPVDFEKDVLLHNREDGLDVYRTEINKVLRDEVMSTSNLVKDRYICVAVNQKTFEDARGFFNRANLELSKRFKKLSSSAVALDLTERLRIYHDFFRAGEEQYYNFDFKTAVKRGSSFKDYICPESLVFHDDYFQMGNRFGRVLLISQYANFLKDTLIEELTSREKNLMLSIDIQTISKDKAIKQIEKKIDNIETDIQRWQDKQNKHNNFASSIPYRKRQMQEAAQEFLEDVTSNDQHVMYILITLVHMSDSKKQLDDDTEGLLTSSRTHSCALNKLWFQQEDGLNTVLPYGHKRISAKRTMTTETAAILVPFSAQEISDKNGMWLGHNAVSKNLILVNRKRLLNGNGFYVGKSGAGKSFAVKLMEVLTMLQTTDDVIIVDPDREYSDIVRALGGEVIVISPNTKNYINAMELVGAVDEENFDKLAQIRLKSNFVQSLCEQARKEKNITSGELSIIDRCVTIVFNRYFDQINAGKSAKPITLEQFYTELCAQKEPEAKRLALDLEIFIKGSLNIFAQQTNIKTDGRLICFDIFEIGRSLMGLGSLVMLDFINKRMIDNRMHGRFTWVTFDEYQFILDLESAAEYFKWCWQHARKMGGIMTAATQNAGPVLRSPVGRIMLANSEFIVMLAQDASDRDELEKMLSLTSEQLDFLNGGVVGQGLVKVGASIVPWENNFPENTQLYRMMDTRAGGEDKEKRD